MLNLVSIYKSLVPIPVVIPGITWSVHHKISNATTFFGKPKGPPKFIQRELWYLGKTQCTYHWMECHWKLYCSNFPKSVWLESNPPQSQGLQMGKIGPWIEEVQGTSTSHSAVHWVIMLIWSLMFSRIITNCFLILSVFTCKYILYVYTCVFDIILFTWHQIDLGMSEHSFVKENMNPNVFQGSHNLGTF